MQPLLEVPLSYIKILLCICNKGPLLIITGWGKIAVYGIMRKIMEREKGWGVFVRSIIRGGSYVKETFWRLITLNMLKDHVKGN